MMYSPIIALYVTSSNSENCSNMKSKYSLLDAILTSIKQQFIGLTLYEIYPFIKSKLLLINPDYYKGFR